MEYENILNRIVEIINLSEQKKKELEAKGIFDNDITSQDNKNFIIFNPYYIYKDYYNEFEILKNKELTYYLVKNDKYSMLKNQSLISECLKRINEDIENKGDYKELIDIINKVTDCDVSLLTYVNGYFVCQSDVLRFEELCNMYKIGIAKKVIDNKDETIEVVQNAINHVAEQKLRIKEHINKLNNRELINNDSTNIKINNDSTNEFKNDNKSKYAEVKNNDDKLNITLNCKYKEFVYLGMLGYLNYKMVLDLKDVMTQEEYAELLEILKEYKIFNKEEILNIKMDVRKEIRDISTIDELVAYLAIKEGLNVNALEALIPSIGSKNYSYLMDKLYRYGKIDDKSYIEFLKKYTFGNGDINKGR